MHFCIKHSGAPRLFCKNLIFNQWAQWRLPDGWLGWQIQAEAQFYTQLLFKPQLRTGHLTFWAVGAVRTAHCAKVQIYEQGKIGLQFLFMEKELKSCIGVLSRADLAGHGQFSQSVDFCQKGWDGYALAIRPALKRMPVQDFNYFLIMLYVLPFLHDISKNWRSTLPCYIFELSNSVAVIAVVAHSF